ncbi:MAG: Ig-like domain repeat protein, partial [Clostridia bacterium]
VTGSGTIASATQTVSDADLSGLADGTVTLSLTLTDTAGNPGSAVIDTVEKDATPPAGYSASISQTAVNNTNKDTIDFTIAGAEVGAAYSFTFSSTGGGTDVTGSGTIVSATQTISDADLSGLADGTVTLSLTLTDTAGNAGSAVTDTVEKDVVAPAVVTDQAASDTGSDGTVTVTWTNPSTSDLAAIYITWENPTGITGSASVASTQSALITSYTTPVLTNDIEYSFALQAVDAAGNQSSVGSTTATPGTSDLTLTLTDLSVALGPVLTYTGTSELVNIYYWADSSFEPSAGVTTSLFTSGMELTGLGGDNTFSFYFDNGIGVDSITYTLIWDSVNLRYGTEAEPGIPISRSLSPSTPAAAHPAPTYTSTAPTPRRPSSYANSISFTTAAPPPVTTPARWLAPIASEPEAAPNHTPVGSAGSLAPTPRMSASAQAKANAILAAYSIPAT